MSRWVRRAAAGAAVPLALVVAACAGGTSLKDAALGTWDCTVTDGARSLSSTVTVGDGIYEVSRSGDGVPHSGTWELDGGTLRVEGDDGPYTADGLPSDVAESMGLKFGEGEKPELSPWSVRWKDGTVRFPYHGLTVKCRKV
ncbi:hypothetical protein QLX52_10445 [Streptomyces albus]|uniref:hypothetical protein n=1 Tax=Streptomyces albus TaxID=1888 RepID=UPI0024ADF87E|nr:hypothetical protein [Streptomyces albus]MDI6409253.1 hypothetical protein [Streptomyces albus]